MRISLIWAMSRNRVIGLGNALPWHLPTEMRHFRESTLNCPVIMGRKTLDSMGRPLPDRINIILSSRPLEKRGIVHASSMLDALRTADRLAPDARDVWIAGGARVYREAMPYAHRLVCTLVAADLEGDVFFPPFDESEWQLAEERCHPADTENEYGFAVRYLNRVTAPTPVS